MMDDNNNNRLHQQIYTRLNTSKTNWLSIQRHIYVIQKMDLRYYTTTTTKSLATFCFLSLQNIKKVVVVVAAAVLLAPAHLSRIRDDHSADWAVPCLTMQHHLELSLIHTHTHTRGNQITHWRASGGGFLF